MAKAEGDRSEDSVGKVSMRCVGWYLQIGTAPSAFAVGMLRDLCVPSFPFFSGIVYDETRTLPSTLVHVSGVRHRRAPEVAG